MLKGRNFQDKKKAKTNKYKKAYQKPFKTSKNTFFVKW